MAKKKKRQASNYGCLDVQEHARDDSVVSGSFLWLEGWYRALCCQFFLLFKEGEEGGNILGVKLEKGYNYFPGPSLWNPWSRWM